MKLRAVRNAAEVSLKDEKWRFWLPKGLRVFTRCVEFRYNPHVLADEGYARRYGLGYIAAHQAHEPSIRKPTDANGARE